MGNFIVSAVAGVTVVLGLAVAPAGVARADTATVLPITSFGQMVVDSAQGRIFISSPSDGEILVTDMNGYVVGTITGQTSVFGMALSPDGSTLYAAVIGNGVVVAISTTSLTETASYAVPGNPVSVAVESGELWVAAGNQIGDINLAASSPSFQAQPALGTWNSPVLAADPSDSGVLVVSSQTDRAVAATYNVATNPPTTIAGPASLQGCSLSDTTQSLAVEPGGQEFVDVCDNVNGQNSGTDYRYSTATLNQLSSYPSGYFPDALAIAPNGDVAIGTADDLNNQDFTDVFVYGQDATTPLNSYNLGSYQVVNPGGVAWSPDGSALAAVTWSDSTGTQLYSLHVVYPSRVGSTITMTGPASSQYGKAVSVAGQLTLASGTLPPGTTVTVTRALANGGDAGQFTVPVASNGSFALTDTPPDLGAFVYTAVYAGTATIAPASNTYDLTVTRALPSLTITTGVLTFNYGQTISITAHLGRTDTNRTVSIYAQPAGSTTRTLLKTGTVNSNGALSTSYRAVHNTTFEAVFTGDARYLPRTTTHRVAVHAGVTAKQSGYYSSKTINGVVYRLYHKTHPQGVLAGVTPNHAGQCVVFETQENYKGKWYDYKTGCYTLSKTSQVVASFNISGDPIGVRYRIRADYMHNSSDTTNLDNDSSWQYFMTEK